MEKVEFSEWLTQKYIDWRGSSYGHEKTVTAFAEYLGIKQSLVSQWMKKGGKKPKSKATIDKLIKSFGSEVYDILGLSKQSAGLSFDLSSDSPVIKHFSELMEAIEERFREKGITGNSPDAEKTLIEIMGEFGFKYIETVNDDD